MITPIVKGSVGPKPIALLPLLLAASPSLAQVPTNRLVTLAASEDDRVRSGRVLLQITEEQLLAGRQAPAAQGGGQSPGADGARAQVLSQYSREIVFEKSQHVIVVRTSSADNVPASYTRYDPKVVRAFSAFPAAGQVQGTRVVTVGRPSGVPMDVELWCACLLHRLKETFDYDPQRVRLVNYEPRTHRYRLQVGGRGDPTFALFELEVDPRPSISRSEARDKGGAIDQSWQVRQATQPQGVSYPAEIVRVQGTSRTRIRCVSVTLNCALSRSDLEFGDYPGGALVEDRRFSPSLAYYQGKHQFTDEELFRASRDPSLLQRIEKHDSDRARAANGAVAVTVTVLVAIALVLVVARMRALVSGRHRADRAGQSPGGA